MTHAVLSEWCADQWSPLVLRWESQHDYHAIQLTDRFNTAHPLIILLQLSRVTSYFDVYSLNTAEYENKEIPKIHLTADEFL